MKIPRGKQIPAPRADPTNTFLARHIIEPGTEDAQTSVPLNIPSQISTDHLHGRLRVNT